MKHSQILDKLSHRWLVDSISHDICYLLAFRPHDTLETHLFKRWNCVLKSSDTENQNYRDRVRLALTVILHKYGQPIEHHLKNAFNAIDGLNKRVVLSDAFERQSADIKAFLRTPPPILKRNPSLKPPTTYYRQNDVLSIQVRDRFFGAHVIKITGVNESPIIRLYEGCFKECPTLEDVTKNQLSEGRFRIHGLTYMPDLAKQVILLGAGHTPVHIPPKKGTFYDINPNADFMSDMFQISDILAQRLDTVI